MAYNQTNKLRRYKKVIDIVNRHYIPDVTTYKGVFEKYVYPVYPMTYATFMRIVSTPVDKHLRELENNENKISDEE